MLRRRHNRAMRSPVQHAAARWGGEMEFVLSTTRNCSSGFAEVCGCALAATVSLAEASDWPGQHAAARRPGEVGPVLSTTRNWRAAVGETGEKFSEPNYLTD